MKPTILESELPKDLDPPFRGWVRDWVRCKKCGGVYANDYQPYSLSNPIRTLPCHHSAYDDLETLEVISE